MSTESFEEVVDTLREPGTLERLKEGAFDLAIHVGLALLVLLVGLFLVNILVKFVVTRLRKRKADVTFTSFMETILLFVLRILVVGFALGVLGIRDVTIAAAIGSLGIAVGLGLQGSLQNFASGLLIVLFRPFRLGDWVDVNDVGGTVEDIGILYTTMRTADNLKTVVPNSILTSQALINSSAYPTRRADLRYVIRYEEDLSQVREILMKIATEDPRVLEEPAPKFHVEEFTERGISCVLKVWTTKENYWELLWDIREQGKNALEREGIEMPHPTFLYMDPKES